MYYNSKENNLKEVENKIYFITFYSEKNFINLISTIGE